MDQAQAGQVQQAQSSSNLSVTAQDPAKTQQAQTQQDSVAAKTTVAPVAAANAPATSAQSRGSYMLVELNKTLKAKKLKPGDKIKAEVAQAVVSHGKVIIPVETELVGHVTEVSVREGENSESRLGIVFDRILLKHYHDINFRAVVQAVAPAVARKSRVDQPSQMLPPSMMGGGSRSTTATPVGSSNATSSRGQVNASASSSMSAAADGASTFQTPLTVKQYPTARANSGTSSALDSDSGAKPLSIGMPQGVTGIKGLSLSANPSAKTPGPVIVSNTDNVKLESGTQILLHVLTVEAQK
jgi:biotin carboxyl carrier protein